MPHPVAQEYLEELLEYARDVGACSAWSMRRTDGPKPNRVFRVTVEGSTYTWTPQAAEAFGIGVAAATPEEEATT